MSTIPFTVYDFFGCLAAGFILLAAGDYAFDLERLVRDDLTLPRAVFWVIAAYIAGHIIANLAGFALERKLLREMLHCPEDLLLQDRDPRRWTRLFPGYYQPLPPAMRTRINERATQRTGSSQSGIALFFHCHAIVKRDAVTLERLSNFLNLYGFCRNSCLAACLAVVLLLIGAGHDWWRGDAYEPQKLWLAAGGVVVAIGMFYRYLKFYRQYTLETFVTYAELD